MIFDIEFKREKDRIEFEIKYRIKRKNILVDSYSKCFGLAWTFLRDPFLNPIYYMEFMGYGKPKEILKECLKEGIKIKFFAWLPINDKQATWEKIRGRW